MDPFPQDAPGVLAIPPKIPLAQQSSHNRRVIRLRRNRKPAPHKTPEQTSGLADYTKPPSQGDLGGR